MNLNPRMEPQSLLLALHSEDKKKALNSRHYLVEPSEGELGQEGAGALVNACFAPVPLRKSQQWQV